MAESSLIIGSSLNGFSGNRRPTSGIPLTGSHWRRIAKACTDAGLAYVTVAESFAPNGVIDPQAGTADIVLDSTVLSAFIARVTEGLSVMSTAITTYMEPFNVAKASATIDHVSEGRGGLVIRTAGSNIGRWSAPLCRYAVGSDCADYLEARDFVEVVRLLWDSWEDGAEIRDAANLRFFDRNLIHHVDFSSRFFSIKGPLTTPRPPQGQLPVAVVVGNRSALDLATDIADIAFCPNLAIVRSLEEAVTTSGRDRKGRPLRVVLDFDLNLAGSSSRRVSNSVYSGNGWSRTRYTGNVSGLHAWLTQLCEDVTGVRIFSADPLRDLSSLCMSDTFAEFASAWRVHRTSRSLWGLPVAPNVFTRSFQ